MKRVRVARPVLSATILGCMVVCFGVMIGCASRRVVGEPPVGTANLSPVADPAAGPPTGPPRDMWNQRLTG
jgi:hypothetical protein